MWSRSGNITFVHEKDIVPYCFARCKGNWKKEPECAYSLSMFLNVWLLHPLIEVLIDALRPTRESCDT